MSPKAQQILELDTQGLGRVEIARLVGCSRVYAWMVVKKAGRQVPGKGRHTRPNAKPPRPVRQLPSAPRRFDGSTTGAV